MHSAKVIDALALQCLNGWKFLAVATHIVATGIFEFLEDQKTVNNKIEQRAETDPNREVFAVHSIETSFRHCDVAVVASAPDTP